MLDPRVVNERIYTHNALPLLARRDTCQARFNVDGLVFEGNRSTDWPSSTYVQFFRSGIVEAVDTGMLRSREQKNEIRTLNVETEIFEHLPGYLRLLKELGVDAPFAIMLSLLHVRGFTHAGRKTQFATATNSVPVFDRDVVRLPEIVLEGEDLEKPIQSLLEPLMHALWQAGGWTACPRYENGSYAPNTRKGESCSPS